MPDFGNARLVVHRDRVFVVMKSNSVAVRWTVDEFAIDGDRLVPLEHLEDLERDPFGE